jgi:uncharacterized repeat protein (TIGR01451 family)
VAPGQEVSQTFYRAAGQTWSFQEDDLPGYALADLRCASATGASGVDADATTRAASIRLAARDTVTCTYVNTLAPPPPVRPPAAGLVLAKRTIGGTGTFAIDVEGETPHSVALTTTAEEVAVPSDELTVDPGHYTVDEKLERQPDGEWALTGAECDGQDRPIGDPIGLDVVAGTTSTCVLTNTFTPSGSIVVRKVTEGATAKVGFLIRPDAEHEAANYVQAATTTRQGVAARAEGDDTSSLPLGTYSIIETDPATPGGRWTLDGVICDGVPIGAAQGRATVTLTAAHPSADCTFYDHFTRGAEPENPSSPPPSGVTGAAAANGPTANLSITKTVTPRVARPGQRVVYRIVVVNHGPATAYDVVGTELGPTDRRLLTVHASRGTCTRRRPIHCRVGSIEPGHRVVVTATTHALPRASRTLNRVAVVTSTSERRLSDNRAQVTTVVRGPARPPAVTG